MVVQRQQEDYMDAAWEQVGDVLARQPAACGSRRSRWRSSRVWHGAHLQPIGPARPERFLA